MTADPRTSGGNAPSPWLIVTGIVGALALIFLLGAGVGAQWGAPQWGPLAEWLAGIATLAAVVVALRESIRARHEAQRGHLARLVDHEVTRRRECMTALGDLWGALVSLQIDFRSLINYLDDLEPTFNPVEQRSPASITAPVKTYGDEIHEQIEKFMAKWMDRIEPPLFVALYLLHGTAMYPAVGQINNGINTIRQQGIPSITRPILDGQRPVTTPIRNMWNDVLRLRDEHLKLAHEHFSLERTEVEKYVRQNWTQSP
ncbi:hypothetical protein PFJ02_21235 [Mycobacterium xenopi]|uniref:Transmembrane protein n=1 Tax=Mycobacterium xenopi TaxID=1789 RepID=A0AAD1M0W3_MYCXE|nr:hypothetical protein [Mycobacterium xenopi]MDA3641400.1 hypothetical protein [Mycobacterium xenopi]MDA3664520.1 hypothetical protein [Mycobacterium xenopi]BBU21820.1 hypothetical protein MYXE_16090 [Mycobacterium xenopi]SPX93631.1 Uncharacterised protein [Mycobacterium xenopi]